MFKVVLLFVVAVVAAALPPGGTFIDDDGNTHESAIEAIAHIGVTLGCNPPTNDRFCPEEVVTRGQMAAFLSRARMLSSTDTDWFDDDNGDTFENDTNRLADAGITFGCNPPLNTWFCPDDPVTRGQMAAMLVRAYDYPPTATDHFGDDTGHTLEDAINRLAEQEVTVGCNPPANDRFCPDDPVTRAQMASFLSRALDLTPIRPPPRLQQTVRIEPRDTWGARSPDPSLMVPHTVQQLTVHHAGTQSGTTGPAQIRGWQNFHVDDRGWGDIAYHLIIGIDGTVFEGRHREYRGDTGTTYDTTGHFLVVVEGNFNIDRPTSAQLDSLVAVLAGASREYGVSPSTISGHRDHAPTSCPGTHLGALLDSGEITRHVEDLIATGGVELVWPEA